MPDIISAYREDRLCDIGAKPADRLAGGAHPAASRFERCLRYVDDCEITVPEIQQVIDQRRGATADVDDGCAAVTLRGALV